MIRLRRRAHSFVPMIAVLLAAGCLHRLASPPPSSFSSGPSATGPASTSIGFVLTGGGAFGAWEVGAIDAFFDLWHQKYGADPPVAAVAGSSTGALIAPFVLLGRDDLVTARAWYTHIRQRDILAPKVGAFLPFPLFAITTSSVYSVGYTEKPSGTPSGLYKALRQALPLDRIARAWPAKRLAVATLDFKDGHPDVVTNAPRDTQRLPDGILASAMAPLALPPVPFERSGNRGRGKTPHLDGSIYAIAPFQALFDIAAIEKPIALTHIVAVSAFPAFPGDDQSPTDQPFPQRPKFKSIADRLNALLSESSATKEISLARAAIALLAAGADHETVQSITGLEVPATVRNLIVLAPKTRLGWQVLKFDPTAMTKLYRQGYQETRATLTLELIPGPQSAQ